MLASIHGKDPGPHRRFTRTPLPLGLPVLSFSSSDLSTCLSAPLSIWLILQSSNVTHCTPPTPRVIPSSALSSELWLPILRPHLVLDSSKLNPDSHCPSTLLPPLSLSLLFPLEFSHWFPKLHLILPWVLVVETRYLHWIPGTLLFSLAPQVLSMSVSSLLETWAGVSKPSLHPR